jgi:hypothetical protein
VCFIVLGLLDLNKGPIYEPLMNLMQPWNLGIYELSWAYFLIIGHWISLLKASLMQDAIKITSLHTLLLLQFQINASNMTTLSCFIYKINWNNYFWGQFGWLPTYNVGVTNGLSMDLMVGTTKVVNFSNFCKVKFVRVLNELGIVCIMVSTFQTLMVWSINCLEPNLNSFELNK